MIGDAVEFGRHAPFVIAAYGASFLLIGGLILNRWSKLKKALEAEKDGRSDESDGV